MPVKAPAELQITAEFLLKKTGSFLYLKGQNEWVNVNVWSPLASALTAVLLLVYTVHIGSIGIFTYLFSVNISGAVLDYLYFRKYLSSSSGPLDFNPGKPMNYMAHSYVTFQTEIFYFQYLRHLETHKKITDVFVKPAEDWCANITHTRLTYKRRHNDILQVFVLLLLVLTQLSSRVFHFNT